MMSRKTIVSAMTSTMTTAPDEISTARLEIPDIQGVLVVSCSVLQDSDVIRKVVRWYGNTAYSFRIGSVVEKFLNLIVIAAFRPVGWSKRRRESKYSISIGD